MEEFKKGNYYEQRYQRRNSRITTEALHVGNRIIKCVFCNDGHYSDKCSVVTDADARMEIVRKHKLCYKCLGSAHNARNCRSTMKCYSCRSGSHHTAICKQRNTAMSSRKLNYLQNKQTPNVNQNEQSQSTRVSLMTVNQNPVLLQTIRVTVSDVRETKKVRANVIFDGGSQKTYMSQKLVNKLNLKAIGEQEMKINAFGDTDGKLITVK